MATREFAIRKEIVGKQSERNLIWSLESDFRHFNRAKTTGEPPSRLIFRHSKRLASRRATRSLDVQNDWRAAEPAQRIRKDY